MAFITELWESVFTPGTSPALIKATHGSFILLIISLISLIYLSGSIHFINLLIIALFLYGTVVWFINELQQLKLKANEELGEPVNDGSEELTSKHKSFNRLSNAHSATEEAVDKDSRLKSDSTSTSIDKKLVPLKRKT
ncbi:uncharacterized protein PRCAT00001675001 [Priceomyces carsonii]|uniref:uncharacterized protein n=1 Tax=Priceomyces carsonii TaxID=28549 RepID=UPI002EDAFF16|nr:unnamed protein product [Priceomyces carsonii]